MSVVVIVFAKAPVPGAVKTRLIPALGSGGAAVLHARLVERTLRTACAARLGRVVLCCAPDASHPFFAECAAPYGVALTEQGGGDLGARMHAALARALATADAVLLVGSDCPALTPDYLTRAAAHLAGGVDVALGPAEDGGYVLVAASRADPAMFAHIHWGEPTVMAAQRDSLRRLGWRWAELPTLWDVDVSADLARVRAELPDGAALLAVGDGQLAGAAARPPDAARGSAR